MAQDLTYTDETATSDTFNPTDVVSEMTITGSFTGYVKLQHSIPDADEWSNVVVTDRPWSNAISTPDLAMDYRVVAKGIVGTVNVYFGP